MKELPGFVQAYLAWDEHATDFSLCSSVPVITVQASPKDSEAIQEPAPMLRLDMVTESPFW